MHLTRRQWLQAGATCAFAPSVIRALALDLVDETVARASDVIRGYSAEGFHRTATAVDRASADRLMALARAAGATPRLEPFELSQVDPIAQFVEIDGRRIEGLVMFDAPFTSADGVTGALGDVNGDRPVAFTRIAPNGEAALRRVRTASAHRAIVAATTGAEPGLCPVNAGWFVEPFGPPLLQVSSEYADAFDRAARAGSTVRVVAQATRQRATAYNVVADVPGARADLAPVCVMTPRSGWHANASERGGGLVCWLEALRAAVAARSERAVRFIASSGHELGHLGLHAYLDRNGTLARDGLAWVHFGANIGASTGDVGMTASDARLVESARAALANYQLDGIRQSTPAQVAGEAATISSQGGRFVSFIGQNRWFHHPRDLWPDAVDVRTVARFARATADLVVALAHITTSSGRL
jgi:hypothetical protein